MNKLAAVLGSIVVLAVLAGVFVLAWHGDIPGSAALVVATSALSTVGGAFAVHSGAKLGLNASAAASAPSTTSDTTSE